MHFSTWDQHTADRKSNLGSQIIWKTSSDLILAQKCQVILNFRCRGICLLMRLWKTCFHVSALFPLWATFSCALQFHKLKPVSKRRMWNFIRSISTFWNSIEDYMFWND